MNKYKVVYGYSGQEDRNGHSTSTRIFNTYDEAKNFIKELPKTKSIKSAYYDGSGYLIEHFNLYAKIRCEGKDFWIEGNKNEVIMEKGGLVSIYAIEKFCETAGHSAINGWKEICRKHGIELKVA